MDYDALERSQDELREWGSEFIPPLEQGELEELLPLPDAETLASNTLSGMAATLRGIASEAERYYFLKRVLDDLTRAKDDLAEEIKTNGLDDVGCAGGRAYIEVGEHTTTRLDGRALEQALGKQALEPYRKAGVVKTIKIKYLKEASE